MLIDEARTPLIISRKHDNTEEKQTYLQAMSLATKLQSQMGFHVNHVERRIELTDQGCEELAEAAKQIGGVWSARRQREELVCQALAAQHLYQRDRHYLVKDSKVLIIDENTGRVMADRSWERGLHQMIEIKESCDISEQQEHIARMTYQRFFRRYLRLAGMTGTAREVRREIWSVYHLPVWRVPTNRANQRKEKESHIYSCEKDKWTAVIHKINTMQRQGRPVLVGTRSVAGSEHLSSLLDKKGIDHQVLNAYEDAQEALIVAKAGVKGCVTVATNMAGRGSDIPLGDGVIERGLVVR